MGKYGEKITDNSVWITATPTALAKTLPFYVTETGHFTAEADYAVARERHESFLLIYTVGGEGVLQTGDAKMQLRENDAVIIDCHRPHSYAASGGEWEFFWVHFDGVCTKAMFGIAYPSGEPFAVAIGNRHDFEYRIKELACCAEKNDIAGHADISLCIHSLINMVCTSAVDGISKQKSADGYISRTLEFIENNYSAQITVDDMIKDIHISKYHFIRLFRRIVGITPYSYLTNYRINMSKTLLRTTDKSIAEIAEVCGFADTSNFITHFKKHTGQKPNGYRHDFS